MKRVVAIAALGAALVLVTAGCAGSTSAFGRYSILLVGHDNDAARIFVWSPGSSAKPLTGPQPWGPIHQGDYFVGTRGPVWSPDRRSIVFEQDVPNGLFPPSPEIFLMRSDGTHAKLFSGGLDYSPDDFYAVPSWSPDGHQFVYAQQPYVGADFETEIPQVFTIVDVPSGHERTWRAGSAISEPVWGKPDIAYFSHSGLMLLNPVTGRSRLVTSRFRSGTLAWSPRGVLAVGVRRQIFILTASGRVLGKLSLPHTAKWVCAIAWDPKGERILVATRKSWDEMAGLWVGTLSTKQLQLISPVPTWRNYRYDCGVSWR